MRKKCSIDEMSFKKCFWIVGVVTVVFFILIFWQLQKAPFEKESISGFLSEGRKFYITDVVDGDTVMIKGDVLVRLIGIDTPEKGEACYSEAKERLEELILNQYVFLVKDKTNADSHGRLLRYVFLGNKNINLKMVEEGYAQPMPIQPDLKYAREIKEAADRAKAEKKGCLYKEED